MSDEFPRQSDLPDTKPPEIDEIEMMLRTYHPKPNQSFLEKVKGASWMKPTNALPIRENSARKPIFPKINFYRFATGALTLLLLVVMLSTTSVGQSLAR